MKILSRILLALAVAAFATPALAADLTPHKARYKVRIAVVSGKLDTELRATENGYVATHVIRPTGLSRMLSRGKMYVSSEFSAGHGGVRPVEYHAIDTIRKDPEARIRFDWTRNRASGTVGDEDVEFQLDGISHDSVSVQYELMHDLKNGGADDRYVMFDVDKMRVTRTSDAGTRTVRTSAGEFEVIGVRHQKDGSSRITTLWCAPELDYLPVIIEQHRKGKLNFRATLTHYTPT